MATTRKQGRYKGRLGKMKDRRGVAGTGSDKLMKREEQRSKLLAVSEAAERLGVKPATIRSWILRREKLEIVKIGRLVRITEKSIDQFIDDNTIPPHRTL